MKRRTLNHIYTLQSDVLFSLLALVVACVHDQFYSDVKSCGWGKGQEQADKITAHYKLHCLEGSLHFLYKPEFSAGVDLKNVVSTC